MAQVSRVWRLKLWFSSWLWTKTQMQKQWKRKSEEDVGRDPGPSSVLLPVWIGQVTALRGLFSHLYHGGTLSALPVLRFSA